jgi:predicted DNA-binding WGR domain protein
MADGVLMDEAQCWYIGAQTVQRCRGTLQLQSISFAASANSIIAQKFGDATLIREWGRIGTVGQPKINLHDSEGAAVELLEIWLRRKQRRGYVTRPD